MALWYVGLTGETDIMDGPRLEPKALVLQTSDPDRLLPPKDPKESYA